MQTRVDPSMLGGLQIQIGDKFLDLSVASRIEEVGDKPQSEEWVRKGGREMDGGGGMVAVSSGRGVRARM